MKRLKATVTIALGLVLLSLALGFTLESKWETSSRLQISAPKSAIFPYINSLQMWPTWTVWNQQNYPDTLYSFEGPMSGVGAIQHWNDGSTDGVITIIDSKPEQSIRYSLSMERGEITMQGRIHLQTRGDKTLVVWQLTGDAGDNPLGKIMMLIYKPMIQKDLDGGLKSLKTLLVKAHSLK